MDGHKAVFSNEEAAVDDLATGYFCDKILIDKTLFEIDEGEQNGQKWSKTAVKSGEKKNFYFEDLDVKKWKNHPFLRQPRAASPQHCQCVFTSRTVLLAAPHGHVSVLRQRAPAKFQALPELGAQRLSAL